MVTLYAPLTIKDVMELLPGVSERALRETIRKLGCYSLIGGKMYLELDDFDQLLKETKQCPSKCTGGMGSPTYTAPLTANAYEKALKLATRKSQPLEKRKKKRVSSAPRSMESKKKRPSLRLASAT